MKNPTVKSIMRSWLVQNGFDGLYCELMECGCHFRDRKGYFMGCESDMSDCEPAYKRKPTESEIKAGNLWVMTTKRPR